MNKQTTLITIVVLAVCITVGFFIITNMDKDDKSALSEKDLEGFDITLYEEDKMFVVLHDVTTLDGVPFNNSDIPKKYVLLTFWATWCPDCEKENPSLQYLQDNRADENFTVLAVSIDTSLDALEKYLNAKGYDFPVLINIKNNLWEEYFDWIPTSYLLGPDGYVIAKIVDTVYWDSEEATRMLDYLMGSR
ncbi:MAG: TlpA family protein disulfide reductase [Candidatus Methanoplasma sp.]|jgi:thiol-disulfide isomerase/thioredoxin|nr:TlpA family protein disulfide reductase [Candidatus Methanoplasma sp.]